MLYLFAAWFPGGAAISPPCIGSFPAPRRTGLGVLHHPAPSPSLSQWNRESDLAPCRLSTDGSRRSAELPAHRPKGSRANCVKTRERQCHGQNPLGVGPCFTLALSRAATPLLDPHYQASQLVWVAPTSTHHRPRPRFYTCSRVPASSGPMRGSPWLPRALNVRLDTALGPRGVSVPLARARHGLLPAGGPNPSAFSNQNFRGSTPSGSAPPVTFAPRLLISRSIDAAVTTRAARLDTGLAGSRLPRRDSHPLEHAALPGRTVPVFPLL